MGSELTTHLPESYLTRHRLTSLATSPKNSFLFQGKEVEIVLSGVLDYLQARELRENGFLLKCNLV